jgi:dephospho-CoA kinase
MLKIGITGGIGSGKSLICSIFSMLDVPIYNADLRGRRILETNSTVEKKVMALLGKKAYPEPGKPDRKYIASRVFTDKALLDKLNAIVHPAVKDDFEAYVEKHQDYPYILKEAAIMIEAGTYKNLHGIIVITAPEDLRVSRVMARDGVSREDVMIRVEKQMSESERLKYADYIIYNDGSESLIRQIARIHGELMGKISIGVR